MKLGAALLAVCALASIAVGRAEAGYGVAPDGQAFTVTTTSSGTVASPANLDLVVVTALAVDPARPATIYAGVDQREHRILRSTNGGQTWVIAG